MIKYKRLVSLHRAENPDQSASDQELHQGKKQHGAKPERDGHYPVHSLSLGLCITAPTHVHDLRHTGNQLTAAGANLKELMARMGHDSERAALIYLHSTAECQRALADIVGETARAELAKSKKRKTADIGHAEGSKPPIAWGD